MSFMLCYYRSLCLGVDDNCMYEYDLIVLCIPGYADALLGGW